MRFFNYCFLLFAIVLTSCGRSREEFIQEGETIIVASECFTSDSGQPLFFFKYRDDCSWRILDQMIDGFEYVPGQEYELLVSKLENNGTLCFSLIRTLSSKKLQSRNLPLLIKAADKKNLTRLEYAFPELVKQQSFDGSNQIIRVDTLYIYDGDLVLTEDQFMGMQDKTKSGFELNRHYWSTNIVNYTYASGFLYDSLVQQAIAEWESKTGLLFQYGTSNTGYIEFINGSGAYSTAIGKTGAKQQISLDSNSTYGNAIHEIGHAVGLIHEHCRPDRDSYVSVNYANIWPWEWPQFSLYSSTDAKAHGQFDFSSIMLYHSWAFAIDDSTPTMTTLNGTCFNAQRTELSLGDVSGLYEIYGPPYLKINRSTVVTNDYTSGIYEVYEYTDTYTLGFYSDRSCTIPTTLPQQRRVSINVHHTYYGNNSGGLVEDGNTYNLLLPSGISSYNLGYYNNAENYAMSDPDFSYSLYNVSLF